MVSPRDSRQAQTTLRTLRIARAGNSSGLLITLLLAHKHCRIPGHRTHARGCKRVSVEETFGTPSRPKTRQEVKQRRTGRKSARESTFRCTRKVKCRIVKEPPC